MNNLSAQLLAQLYAQESNDPFLILVTFTHSSFASPIRLVKNSNAIVSRGNTFTPYPFQIVLPTDDGEKLRQVTLTMDNVSLELIDEFRSVTGSDPIGVKVEMILASIPNEVQYSLEELKVVAVQYTRDTIQATLGLDDFLNTEIPSERYTPTNFRGLY